MSNDNDNTFLCVVLLFITFFFMITGMYNIQKARNFEKLITKQDIIEIEDAKYTCNKIEEKVITWEKVNDKK